MKSKLQTSDIFKTAITPSSTLNGACGRGCYTLRGKKGTNSTLSNFSIGTNTYTSDTNMYHLGVKKVQRFTF